ncbi:MAG: hypothetical protein KDB26_01725 [Microthrixaceae bacterium]|nr:hypothetical protein [Microthrixaceae bacterium]
MVENRSKKFRIAAASAVSVLALSGGMLTACNSGAPGGPLVGGGNHGDHSGMDHSGPKQSSQAKKIALYTTMRTLWDQHMQWTYDTIVAFAAGSENLDATLNRLLANQADIGNAIAPFYGADAAAQLTDLLTEHIQEAVPVLTAAKAGDTAALQTAVDDWYDNARRIGEFLESANPAWAREDMPEMMKGHITQTIGYATAVLTGDHADAIVQYDQAQAHMAEMADMLSAGLISQFPRKF